MQDEFFVVTAYRWGDKENHSYVVGVFDDVNDANFAAEKERDHRGGKYECEVVLMTLNDTTKKRTIIKGII